MADDDFLLALDELERVLDANAERTRVMKARIARIRAERAEGSSYPEIVTAEQRPLIVQILTKSAQELDRAGVAVRRSEARTLHDEGLTMDQIAQLFGVTRQRVSALLKGGRSPERTRA